MHKAPVFTTPAKSALSIDPLGLQSANMSLYRTLLPGINNVANAIRVYSALCWALREARVKAKAEADDPDAFRELCAAALEKMDLLLVWCNREHRSGLPGTDRLWPKDNQMATLRLSEILSSEQAKRKKEVGEVNTARGAYLMTAPQYRPSLVNGLRFMQPDTEVHGTFALTPAGNELAAGFERHLIETVAGSEDVGATQILVDWLRNPREVQILAANVPTFYPLLRLDQANAQEQKAFLSQYMPSPGHFPDSEVWDMRHKGLTLALRALVASEGAYAADNGFVPADIVRHAMGSGYGPDGTAVDLTNLADARGLWASLQVRQYLKLALETLLRLSEFQIQSLMVSGEEHRIGDVAAGVANLALEEPGMKLSLETWMDAWQTAQGDEAQTLYEAGMAGRGHASQVVPMKDLSGLFGDLRDGAKFRVLSKARKASRLVAVALTYCAVEAGNWATNDKYMREQTRDRLSPALLARLAGRYAKKPVTEFVAMVVRDFVINLHFSVVRERAEAEPTNPRDRYRILPGDEGLERDLDAETRLTEPPVLADRLYCAMQLLTQAGLLEEHPETGSFRSTEEGRRRAAESLALWPPKPEVQSTRAANAVSQLSRGGTA
ncbi:hypothetical protein [Paraburkholderia sp. A1RO-5L]|uniref:hypothetical protein n=1 Tax=Paraburkholderia sp. A1RO-5L TaxID=3028370 RepID=UPI003B76A61D